MKLYQVSEKPVSYKASIALTLHIRFYTGKVIKMYTIFSHQCSYQRVLNSCAFGSQTDWSHMVSLLQFCAYIILFSDHPENAPSYNLCIYFIAICLYCGFV